jgi:hypothetical protein
MNLRATIMATAALAAIAFAQTPQVLAQNAGTKAGASAGAGGSGQMQGSGSVPARAPSGGGQMSRGHAENSGGMSGKSGKSGTAGVQMGARTGGTTIHERSQTRVGLYSGGREDVILHRRRAHGTIVYNDEPSRRVVIRDRRPHGVAVYNDESRRRVTIRESRPGVSISERTVGRSHLGGEVNIRTGGHSGVSTTTGSATRTNQGQGATPAPSKGAGTGGSPTGGQAGVTGGNAGKQSGSSTTGQGTR